MLVIRSAQMATLSDAFRLPFHRRILAFLRETLPEKVEGMEDGRIISQIAEADRKATGYGLRTERGITLFAALSFLIGPKFDELPQIQALLKLPQLDPDFKIRWYVKSLALYKEREEREWNLAPPAPGPVARIIGALIAALCSPFFLQMAPAGALAGGMGTLAATGGLAALGADLAAFGVAALAVASSPVVIGVVVAAVVVGGIYVLATQTKAADEKSESVPTTQPQTATQECSGQDNGEDPNSTGDSPTDVAPDANPSEDFGPNNLPANPDDLLDAGWKEVTHPEMVKTGSREFVDPETGMKVRFDPGKPGKPGWEGKDHYHVDNPESTGKGNQYLDEEGNPAPRGSKRSHIPPKCK